MKSFDVRKKKLFFLLIAVLIIIAGLVTFLIAGFGKGLVSDGGYMVTTRVSSDFDFETTPQETVENYILSLLGQEATLSYEDSMANTYQIMIIESEIPFSYTKETFLEAVNGEYEGLLMEDWTDFHTLQPSLTTEDWTPLLIVVPIILLIVFLVTWATIGIRTGLLAVVGALLSGLMTFSLLILLRFPAGSAVIASVAMVAVYGTAASISMSCRINRAAEASRKSDLNTVVREVTDISIKPFLFYVLACVAVFIVFTGLGLAFGADASWFQYSAAIAIAMLVPRCYSDLLVPGLYFGR